MAITDPTTSAPNESAGSRTLIHAQRRRSVPETVAGLHRNSHLIGRVAR
jgi:hypothetical protein